jgi:hypothetical protein
MTDLEKKNQQLIKEIEELKDWVNELSKHLIELYENRHKDRGPKGGNYSREISYHLGR